MTKTDAKLGLKTLYADRVSRLVRAGSRGRGVAPGEFFARLPKGERRRVRKALRAAGFAALAVA